MSKYLTEQSTEELRALFVGKSVTKVGEDTLELSDGTRLRLGGNEGGCACSAGDYELTRLSGCENIITNVEVDARPASDYEDGEGIYRLFVYAANQQIELAAFEGDDGNGYYGTGFWVEVLDD